MSTPGGQTEGFAYDSSGGLISRGVGILAQPFPVDGHGRPTADGAGGPVSWSTDGELTGLARPGGGQSTFGYDGFGRLASIAGGGSTAEYAYDGLGRRVALRVDGQLTRRYVYGAGLFPRARLDAGGDVIERYVYATKEHVPDLIVRRDGTRLRLITDTLGSVRAVVDADSGAVVQRLAYSAYGQVTQDTSPGVQPFGFKGALSDPAAEGAGLVWMGVRAYIPSLARFATPEPLGIAVAWNEHDALGGDPINLIDPDGRAFVVVPIIVGAAIGAVAGAAADVVTQIAINVATGCPWNNIDWGSVAFSGAVGAVTGGYGAVVGRGAAAIPFGPVPEKATKVADRARSHGAPFPGYKGGRTFENDGRGGGTVLPKRGKDGPVTYREWDVDPRTKGVPRGRERVVTGSDGSAFHTTDHYNTFVQFR